LPSCSPQSLRAWALQRVIAIDDATVTDVVADFSRCCGG
jgi:hypothetical protein